MGKHNYVNVKRLPNNREPDWKPWEALKKARDYAHGDRTCDHGNSFKGYCQHLVACCYGHASSGFYDAHTGWRSIPPAFKRHDKNPPAGAWAYYWGGGHGHVALVDVFGNIFTNDIRNGRYSAGAYSREKLMSPEWAFGHRYVGWTWPYPLGPEDGRTPPKTPHIGGGKPKDKKPDPVKFVDGWFTVTARALNGRKHPTTSSKVGHQWERGDKLFLEKAVNHEGRRWYKTDKAGLWVAGGYVDRNETIKKDRRDKKRGVNQGPK